MAGRFDSVVLVVGLLAACASAPLAKPPHNADETAVGRLGTEVTARFTDGAGLTVGTTVRVYGAIRGRVIRLVAIPEGTQIWLELERNLEVWPSATLRKRPGSTLGTYYLDLSPGGPKHDWDDPIGEGGAIDVDEASTIEDVQQRIETTLPPQP